MVQNQRTASIMFSDANISSSSAASSVDGADDYMQRNSFYSAYDGGSPVMMSPWNGSPFAKSPWSSLSEPAAAPQTGLVASLVREEGHIYSLAAAADVLYTGSDSKNIRVWKSMKEFSAFKSNSGLVKAIIISGDRIFTGHQDGKIRVWRIVRKHGNDVVHKRVGTMPTFFDIFKASIRPSNYVEVKRKRTAVWIKHNDAVSCLSMNQEKGILYSASWDRTFKVWKVDGSKCIESVKAHDDAVNSVVCSADGVVYTGSADGTVKVWRRQQNGKVFRHVLQQTLHSQECAVTALAVTESGSVVYCGSSDGLVNFWELEKKLSHGGALKGHKLAVLCLAAAGNLMFSGSADKTICVWRRGGSEHTCLSVLSGHTGPVKCLAVEEEEGGAAGGEKKWRVYSGSLDKSVKVWSVVETTPDLHQIAFAQNGNANWESFT